MLGNSFRQPGFATSIGVVNFSALGGGAGDGFESRARFDDIAVGSKIIFIFAIKDDKLVVGIIERETFGNGFDRVSQPRPRLGDFFQVLLFGLEVLDLHCALFNGIFSKHADGFHHLPDLIATVSIADLHFGIARRQLPHRIRDGLDWRNDRS